MKKKIKLDLLCVFRRWNDVKCNAYPKIMIWLNECRYKNLILCQFQLHTITIIFISIVYVVAPEKRRKYWRNVNQSLEYSNISLKHEAASGRHWILNNNEYKTSETYEVVRSNVYNTASIIVTYFIWDWMVFCAFSHF